MPSYTLNAHELLFNGDGAAPARLINFLDYYENLGALPFHTYDGVGRTLPDAIGKLCETYVKDDLSFVIAITAVIRQGILGYRPLRIVLAGRKRGALAEALTSASREAHPDSRLLAIEEKDSEFLRGGYFDMAALSGGGDIEDPERSVRNLLRVTRAGGVALCMDGGDSRVRECVLKLPGATPEAYGVSQEENVYIKPVAAGDCAEPPDTNGRARELRAAVGVLAGEAGGTCGPQRLSAVISLLADAEKHAARRWSAHNVAFKLELNEAKENALNALYTRDIVFREACIGKLRAFAKSGENAR